MKRRAPLRCIYDEGIDDDKDGKYNEDGIGGIDMNRNFSTRVGYGV